MRLHYEDQFINVANAVQGNNRCLFWELHEIRFTLSKKNVKLLKVKAGGTYSYHCDLKG
jgi:hypothetical protein